MLGLPHQKAVAEQATITPLPLAVLAAVVRTLTQLEHLGLPDKGTLAVIIPEATRVAEAEELQPLGQILPLRQQVVMAALEQRHPILARPLGMLAVAVAVAVVQLEDRLHKAEEPVAYRAAVLGQQAPQILVVAVAVAVVAVVLPRAVMADQVSLSSVILDLNEAQAALLHQAAATPSTRSHRPAPSRHKDLLWL